MFVKDFRKPSVPTWIPGRVLRRLGEVRYEVMADGRTWTRHVKHLKSRDDTAATATSTAPDSSATTSRALLRALAHSSRAPAPLAAAPDATPPSPCSDVASADEDESTTQSSYVDDDGFVTPDDSPDALVQPAEVEPPSRSRRQIRPPNRLDIDPSKKSYR